MHDHLGTIPILRQQKDWIGGVKNGHFSDVQYCIYTDLVGGLIRKSPKICWRNVGMVPYVIM